jgi:hypothetical protein
MARTIFVAVGLALGVAVGLLAQERPVPPDSELVSVPGCAKGRNFVTAEGPEHEPKQVAIAPGRRFRLEGSKETLDAIKRREGQLIEVTGLVRKAALSPGGIAIAGGRIRLGGSSPRQPINDPARDPAYNQPVIDVSSWRLLDGSACK